MPKDEGYLKEIVPELESLKQKTDEIFEDYLGSILDPRLRQRLLPQLWQEAMKWMPGRGWGWNTKILNATACGEEPISLLVMETVIHYNQYDYNEDRKSVV